MDVTVLLAQIREGDSDALDALARQLYPELKAMAYRRARKSAHIGATTLVSETFARMLSSGSLTADDRNQFFGLAATIMRRIVIDEIRYVSANKRIHRDVSLVESLIGNEKQESSEFLLHVDEVLTILESENERLARIFECRYFAGYTNAEAAECLGVSQRTAERLWSQARMRLAELTDAG